jgi:hypothetical protein
MSVVSDNELLVRFVKAGVADPERKIFRRA